MDFLENISLAQYTTFKIGGTARYFCEVGTPEQALQAVAFAKQHNLPVFVLGGGSNLLVSDQGYPGLVMKIRMTGRKILSQDSDHVLLQVGAGEDWDQVVAWSVENDWWGLENLSHIPGLCGAIAVQNVGAYGQEASKVIMSVAVLDTAAGEFLEIDSTDCQFGYRSSIFNQAKAGHYIILNLTLKLDKKPRPILSYRDLKNRFLNRPVTLKEIRQEVIAIRNTKFPFPVQAKNGNAGSFFKNITLGRQAYADFLIRLEKEFGREAVLVMEKKKFEDSQDNIKVPTAALIEICGFKNTSFGNVKINPNQPLVILNGSGKATATEVLALAGKVINSVWSRLGIILKIEPVLLGFTQKELKIIEVS